MTASRANHYVSDFMIQTVLSEWVGGKTLTTLVSTVPIKMLTGLLGLIFEASIDSGKIKNEMYMTSTPQLFSVLERVKK